MKQETWKSIPSFPNYEVSSIGRVRRLTPASGTKPGLIRKSFITPKNKQRGGGYEAVCLYPGKKVVFVHRLVLEAFVGFCPEGYESNHKDGVKTNNALTNLEYVSSSENKQHALGNRFRTMPKREVHPRAKLTEKDVKEIRRYGKIEGINKSELGRIYNVSRSHIVRILKNKTWR